MNDSLASRLLRIKNSSTCALIHAKVDKALANVKRARTLLEKAEQTAIWAEYYDRTHHVTESKVG